MEQTGKKSICGIFDHNVQTENVKISELHDFQGHPFKVEHDMHLFELSKADKSEYVSPYSESVWSKESEMTVEADKKSGRNISFYEAFDRFQADNDVNENDEEIFYGSVFQEFNEQWQGKKEAVLEKKSEIIRQEDIDFSKLSLEERAKLLPPPTSNQMTELKKYQKRMGYDEGKMKSMKYKMTVYDEFLKEYEYRKKHCGVKDNIQKKQRDRER